MRKTILVTGSSRGLGATIAKTLAAQGHNVIINYVQNKTLAKQLVNEIGNDLALAIQADITDRAQVDQLIATASTHCGKIDAVVNNALVGFKFDPTSQESFKYLSWKEYQHQIDGTLKGAIKGTHSVIQRFSQNNTGTILSIGTNLYHIPVGPYHEDPTAKAGLI